ncbi:arrestin red cell-like isoform X3 [Symsagittifera roscoffensis]|uniref:arrestin red cell-like isoform X3 n=1 Tax=Symsagittifera roscoffensis TaxID=84072 RepID=UPI00307B7F75
MADLQDDDQNANGDINDPKKAGTRVFKKSSPNGKITVYIGRRDFLDHLTHVDPIDGVVLIDPEYLKDRKVYCHVLAAFRYGREDLDVLGLTFRKDLYLATQQVYPPPPESEQTNLTRLQERLIKKLGPNAYPFFFQLSPQTTPASVTLQPAPGDTGKPCGVDYELKTYVADSLEDKPHKRNSVRLAIRKLTYAPKKQAPQPSAETSREFIMSSNPLHLEASLDKEMYYHGESISVNVTITNNSNKSVKKVKVSVRQIADICLFSTAQYKCPVAELESEERMPVGPSQTLTKVYTVTPLLSENKDKRGLALDGKLKHEDTNLASSTIVADPAQKENLGIIVQYKVKVKLIVAFGGFGKTTDVSVELPFTLTHPKAEEPELAFQSEVIPGVTKQTVDHNLINFETQGVAAKSEAVAENGPVATSASAGEGGEGGGGGGDLAALIGGGETVQFEDDDFIFEEFTRMRLKGANAEDMEA